MRIKIYRIDEIETIKELSGRRVGTFYIILLYSFLLIIISFFIWSYYSKVDMRIKGIGTLETEVSNSVIVNLVSGKVKNSVLYQGRKVKEGEILYEIENNNLAVEKGFLEKDLKEKRNLRNAMKGLNYELDISVSNYLNKKNAHLVELDLLNIEISEQEKIEDINAEILKVGGISRLEHEKSRNQLMILKQKRRQKEMEYRIASNNELITLEGQIRDIEMKIGLLEGNMKDSKIKAPITGEVELITPVNNGDMLSSGVNVIRIVPDMDSYKINIMVSGNDIVKIRVGNRINYHLNYPDEKKGVLLSGKVILIGKDAIVQETRIRYYLVVGDIESKDVQKLNLKKGMTLESSIIYSRKSILDSLMEILGFKIRSLYNK